MSHVSRNNNVFFYFFAMHFIGLRINGHSKHRSGHGYETASILSSDLETTTFLESDDDVSSRITSTTGRHTNMSSTIDRGTLGKKKKIIRKTILSKRKLFLKMKSLTTPRTNVLLYLSMYQI